MPLVFGSWEEGNGGVSETKRERLQFEFIEAVKGGKRVTECPPNGCCGQRKGQEISEG